MAVSKQRGKEPAAPASTTAPARPANALALAMAARAKAQAGATSTRTAAKPKPAEVKQPEKPETAKPETPKPPKEKQPEKARPAREKLVAESAVKPVIPQAKAPETPRAEPAKTGRAKPSRKAREPVEEPQPKERAKPKASKPKAEQRTRKTSDSKPATPRRNGARQAREAAFSTLEMPPAEAVLTSSAGQQPAAEATKPASAAPVVDLGALLGVKPAKTEPARTEPEGDGGVLAHRFYAEEDAFDVRIEVPANARPEPSLGGDGTNTHVLELLGERRVLSPIPIDLRIDRLEDGVRELLSQRATEGNPRRSLRPSRSTLRKVLFSAVGVLASVELAAAAYINPIISGGISTVLLATGLTAKYGGRILAGIKTALESRRKAREESAKLKEAKDTPIEHIVELARTIGGVENASDQTLRLVAEATFKALVSGDELKLAYNDVIGSPNSTFVHSEFATLFSTFAAENAELVKATFLQEATRLAGERRAQQPTAAAA